MKLSRSSSRLAVVLSCTTVLGAASVLNAADKPADKPTGDAAASAPAATPAEKPLKLPDPVATVNGQKISSKELQTAFDNAVRMSGVDASKLPNQQKLAGYHQLLDDMITERLLRDASKDIKVTDAEVDAQIADIKKNAPKDPPFDEQLKQAGLDEAKLREQVKHGLAETKWIKSQVGDKVEVTDKDAETFYKENIKQFEQPETVRASHILFQVKPDASPEELKKKEAEAQAAYERVSKGEDFAKVADELTEDPSGKGKGGDLNYFPKGAMVPEFDKEVFSMKVGDISKPVKTQFGYHIIKLTDKKPAGTTPLADVKEQLVSYLKNNKQQAAVREVIEKLRSDAKITDNLPEMKAADAAGQASDSNDSQ